MGRFKAWESRFQAWEGLGERINKWTDRQRSPCVLQDFVSFRAAAQKRKFCYSWVRVWPLEVRFLFLSFTQDMIYWWPNWSFFQGLFEHNATSVAFFVHKLYRNESKLLKAKRGKKGSFCMKRMELLYCHEQLGIVLPMLSAFIVLEFEFLHVCDQKWSIVIDYEKNLHNYHGSIWKTKAKTRHFWAVISPHFLDSDGLNSEAGKLKKKTKPASKKISGGKI